MIRPYIYFKRLVDIILSSIILIILSPILIFIALMVKIDSPGPVLFKQRRTGYKGREFNLLKFRTMVKDNDVMDFDKGDTITRVGYFLRKTSLDEFPQFINILKNDMSFVGPRPWITEYWPHYTEEQKRRFDVRPGITGLAQTSGRKGMNILERIKCDIKYVDEISLLTDISIIFKTFLILFDRESNTYNNYTIEDEYLDLINNKIREEKKTVKS